MMKQYILTLSFLLPIVLIGQTNNFWTKKADFPGVKRERAVAFSIGDYGYICSGVDTAEIVLNDLWQYDPTTDSWTQKANLPGSVRRDAIGFALGSKGYVGMGIDNDESISGIKLNDFWEYAPISNTWTQKADFPGVSGLGIYFATAFTIDSKGYVCGGKTGPNTYTNQFWEYKPSIDQWTQRANFPGGVRYQLTSFSIGYNGYVGLGANQDVFKKDFWKFNGGTNQWSQIADLPASERGGACSFSISDRGFVCLGSNGGVLDDLWEYEPTLNEWTVRAPYGGSQRKNAIAFVINNKAYVGTGKGISGKKASMYEYTPSASIVLGLEELNEADVTLYPNPAKNTLTISENNLLKSAMIVTTDGKIIGRYALEKTTTINLNDDGIQAGVYLVFLEDENGKRLATKQLIIL
jgi:N-acetylneuraminic acid mutarotase